MRPARGLCVAGLVATLSASAAWSSPPPPATYAISVSWSGGEPPRKVWLQLGAVAIPFVRDGDVFVARPALAGLTVQEAKLYAAYSDTEASIPVRMTPGRPQIDLMVHRSDAQLECLRPVLDRLDRTTGGYRELIANYFDSQRMMKAWPEGCGTYARRWVVQARYKNNLVLANTPHIERDREAAMQWAEVRPRDSRIARWGVTRFEAEQLELAGLPVAADYDHQQQLWQAGEFADALALNEEMAERIGQDEELARAARTQGITSTRLTLDRGFIQSLATSGPE